MDIIHKYVIFEPGKKHLFLDISSANISTLVPSLYQCVETRSIEIFWLLSQPLPQLVGHHLRLSNVLDRISRPNCEPLYASNTSHRKQKTFLNEYPLHSVLLTTKTHNRTLLFGSILLKHGRHLDYWNQSLNMRIRACYLHCHEADCAATKWYIGNLLRPLELFYFYLWPIYWLSLVIRLGMK
jgi:hypothetical protein